MYDGVYGDGFGVTVQTWAMPLNTYVEQTGTGRAGAAVVFESAGACTGEGEFVVDDGKR